MKAKRLVAMSILALAAGATYAALNLDSADPRRWNAATDCADAGTRVPAIPRIVVVARSDQAQSDELPVARVVVTARRHVAVSSPASAGL